ncbi:MAG: rRNA maturation RNase YbeY [Ignavibacteriales bacterium]
MIKNLVVINEGRIRVNKRLIHRLTGLLLNELELSLLSLPVNFITSKTIWGINKEFLGHDYPTDIITFNYSGNKKDLDGEIFISVQVAAENAVRFNCSLDNELLRLVIHGFLHLTGYDDIDSADRIKMKKAENYLTNKFEYLINSDKLIYDSQNS